jgi:catechol 2,3-dioxygenase-like lactoylglutathione lyase family enzyme
MRLITAMLVGSVLLTSTAIAQTTPAPQQQQGTTIGDIIDLIRKARRDREDKDQQAGAQSPAGNPWGTANQGGAMLGSTLLVVSDLDRATALWRDGLGFQPGAPSTVPQGASLYATFGFPSKASLRTVALTGPDRASTLTLIEMKGSKLDRQRGPARAALVVQVARIDEVMRKVQAMGVQGGTLQPSFGGDGRRGFEWSFRDADGNLVMLYEVTGR